MYKRQLWGKALLEIVNYMEHYGMVRNLKTPVQPRHSWNTNKRISSWTMFNPVSYTHLDVYKRQSVHITIKHPAFLVLALLVLLIMVVMFIIGESLPTRIIPPQVAIIGASLALLVVYGMRIEPVGDVIRDVDWKTLVFLGAIFTLVQALVKTELLQSLSLQFYLWFGTQFTLSLIHI